jgi:acetyltransferase-like isoleucine patch superfamily enzyme
MRIKYIQKLIDKIRNKKNIQCKVHLINTIGENLIEYQENDLKFFEFNIIGNNNKILIKKLSINNTGKLIINLYGDNNEITIGESVFIADKFDITIGQNHKNFGKCNNSKLEIGNNVSIELLDYVTYNSNSYCTIGKDSMIARNVTLFNTDAHPIFNVNTNEIVNKVKGIKIGEHCWLGKYSTILKNSILPDNSILGYGAIYLGGGKTQSYCAFAGNPARCVKENITWSKNGSNGYVQNEL